MRTNLPKPRTRDAERVEPPLLRILLTYGVKLLYTRSVLGPLYWIFATMERIPASKRSTARAPLSAALFGFKPVRSARIGVASSGPCLRPVGTARGEAMTCFPHSFEHFPEAVHIYSLFQNSGLYFGGPVRPRRRPQSLDSRNYLLDFLSSQPGSMRF